MSLQVNQPGQKRGPGEVREPSQIGADSAGTRIEDYDDAASIGGMPKKVQGRSEGLSSVLLSYLEYET